MANISYPDGSLFTSTALTRKQIEIIFQIITAQMLGILTSPWTFTINLVTGQYVNVVPSNVNLYQGQAITGTGIPDNTFIEGVDPATVTLSNAATLTGAITASVTDPNSYEKIRVGWQTQGQPGPSINSDTANIMCTTRDAEYSRMRDIVRTFTDPLITNTDVFTRSWNIKWVFYGPNSLDNARAVRSALITIPFVESYLATYNLYVNPDIKEPDAVPENFQGQWWERADLEVHFNEQISETFTTTVVESVEVMIYTGDVLAADFTIVTD